MPNTLRHLIEASAVEPKLKAQLLEMGDMCAAPVAGAPDALPPLDMDAPTADPTAGDWKADIVAAIGKLVQSGDPMQHAMGLKLMKVLKPSGTPDLGDDEEDDVGDKVDANSAKQESRTPATSTPGSEPITEARAVSLCKLAGIEPTAEIMEALKETTLDHALAVLRLLPGTPAAVPAKTGSAPRSSSPRQTVTVQESAAPKDVKGWAERLLN